MTHPVACLVFWLLLVLALPFFSSHALLCALLLSLPLAWWGQWLGRYRALVRRSRWLLLSLWLILAYGTPGDVWMGLDWAPSDAGMEEASQHVLRLLLMLAGLAWLLARLPRERLTLGLWLMAAPLRVWFGSVDRFVVRLSLVFAYLDESPPKGAWRHVLDESARPALSGVAAADVLDLQRPRWLVADTRGLLLASIGLILLLALP